MFEELYYLPRPRRPPSVVEAARSSAGVSSSVADCPPPVATRCLRLAAALKRSLKEYFIYIFKVQQYDTMKRLMIDQSQWINHQYKGKALVNFHYFPMTYLFFPRSFGGIKSFFDLIHGPLDSRERGHGRRHLDPRLLGVFPVGSLGRGSIYGPLPLFHLVHEHFNFIFGEPDRPLSLQVHNDFSIWHSASLLLKGMAPGTLIGLIE